MPRKKLTCKYSDGKYCKPSIEAYEKGYRKDIVPCSTTPPKSCTIYLKLSKGITLEELFEIE